MVSITCPCAECKYNGKGNKCKAKAIKLSYRNMVTVNEGRVDMWICDKYELSEFAKRIDKSFEGFLQQHGGRQVSRNENYNYRNRSISGRT